MKAVRLLDPGSLVPRKGQGVGVEGQEKGGEEELVHLGRRSTDMNGILEETRLELVSGRWLSPKKPLARVVRGICHGVMRAFACDPPRGPAHAAVESSSSPPAV
ncbi:hypothetical protein PG997_000010 [Apiospora hydei]|uniref:Uncharacterized protein n=1 Tax=Apiospora hydei TaxID=1337664 RepID=A0ABR1X9J0_9PEZI